jgi:hypothetical protein
VTTTSFELHRLADDHKRAGRYELALEAFLAAAAADPASPVLPFNAANTLKALRRFDEAITLYSRAIQISPGFAIARHNRACSLLQVGQLRAGFQEYEWRKVCPTFDDARYKLPRPWTGQDLRGKTLFIYPELYQGDLIQFSRYARLAERVGASVRLAAPAPMHALLQTLSPTIELLAADTTPADSGYDYQSALMTLPAAFATSLETIPAQPYLQADPHRVLRWRQRIGPEGFKIGVAWQGSTAPHAVPLQRSFPLAMLHAISRLPNVRLISLQKQNGLDQLEALPAGMAVENLGDDFDPGPDAFVDTAAVMASCDLFITLDTSVAHLAGALGVPTWVALPYVADWRWLSDRDDSPWYPGMRLFRQKQRADWQAVFGDIEAALRAILPQR